MVLPGNSGAVAGDTPYRSMSVLSYPVQERDIANSIQRREDRACADDLAALDHGAQV
jgi:hypothetical protein